MSAPQKTRRVTIRDIAGRVERIDASLTEPNGALRNALHDILRTYGLVAQIAEIIVQQRDQIQALADAMAIYLGRMIEHDRRATTQHDEFLQMLHALATGADPAEIAQRAQAARDLLAAEALEQHHALELSAAQARKLLKMAQMDALSLVKQAVDEGQAAIAHDAVQAQDEIAQAASEARDTLEQESS